MNREFIDALKSLQKERGIETETLLEAIEEALVAAYRREFVIRIKDKDRAERADDDGDEERDDGITAHIDRETGEMRVYQPITVVEKVEDPNSEISLEEALALSDELEPGDQLVKEVDPADFGRLAAQTAKSVINQRLSQAEKERIHDEFSDRVGGLATGVVQRKDRSEVTVDIDRAEAVLPYSQQSKLDNYRFNQRMRFYILKVDERRNRPIIIVSRSHPDLVRRIFEQESPEIGTGVVEIISIAREAGSRTKMAVISNDPNVDPVGACVGQRGLRVQAVIDELNGEKIDIIAWDPDVQVFISNSLSPAKVVRVILEEEDRSARVIVADHQLSLAIGKEGQNARLAAKLTGWKIDIKSESQYREMIEAAWLPGFDEAVAADEAERFDSDDAVFNEEDYDEMDDELLQVDATGPADEREAIDFFDNLEQTIDVMSDDAAAFESEEAEATDEEEE
ncbi:MAG: transcription termination/antitermination protein NusA [Clostridiaceae bacterium]|nr:transcription termination/antitermination protein NusA [Clostridiaceae bacterium]HZJ90113.1 transcription termination factor NusA [Oscillospiraceae bacterium]